METALVIFFAATFSLFNSLHVINQWLKNPPDRVFTGISHFFADYFLYVSQFEQGARGAWIFARHLFTNEPMQPTWIYWFNVTAGHLGSIIGLSPFASYNIFLFLLVLLVLLLWYYVSFLLYPKSRLNRWFCFTFITTASSFFDGKSFLGQFWFSPGLAFNRLGGVPHQVFQTILFLLLIILFTKNVDKPKNILILIGLSFLAGTANPVQMIIFILAATVTTVLPHATKRFHVSIHEITHPLLLVISFGGLGMWITNLEFTKQTVFIAAKTWELSQAVPATVLNLLLNIGPIIFLVPFGLKMYFKKLSPLRLLFFVYGTVAITFFLSPIPKLLGVSPSRFLGPIPYALLAILATEAVFGISKNIKYQVAIVSLFIFVTLPALYQQVTDRVTPYRNPLLLMDTMYNHVPKLTVEGLKVLEKIPEDPTHPVVLTDPHDPIEVLVPVFTGKISFSGHPIHTLYPNVKEKARQQFFNEEMSEQTAKTFLLNHRIGYIIAAPKSKLSFPFLSRVYQNEEMMIFRFQPNE